MTKTRNWFAALLWIALLTLPQMAWAANEKAPLYRIDLTEMGSAVPLAEVGINILAAIPNDHALAELTDRQLSQVIRMGYTVQYLAPSLYEFSQQEETDNYYNYSTLTAQLQAWATTYANIANLYDLGTTVQGRHIWGMKISDNPGLEEDEIVCYFCGAHHGNEKISAEVPMYFLNYIFSNYGEDPNVTYWVDNREIWVIPVVNPDGYNNNSRYNANNVDINRNYSFHWSESASNYGPYPFSEVEAQAVRNLNLAHHFTTGHSYHSYGEEILYPFAWASNRPSPDNSFFVEITNAMAALNGYYPMLSGNLYPHGGEHNDYLYAEKGVMSVTSEVWGGPGYNPPIDQIITVCQENLPTDLYLLQRTGEAQITGVVTDSASGEPLVAQVKVPQLWNPNEIYPRYSEPTFGRYRHLVTPGTYSLEVSKSGYATKTYTNLVVSAGTPLVQDVALSFVGFPNVVIDVEPINPPIIIPPEGGSFSYTLNITNSSGAAQVIDVWINFTLPTGQIYGPVVLRTNVPIGIGAIINRTLSRNIPGTARPGTYTVNAYVGDYDMTEIWSEDHFDFVKTGAEGTISDYLPPSEEFQLDEELNQITSLPDQFCLQAYPNPFNPTTAISYRLSANSYVNLKVYDTAGRLAATLVNGWRAAGTHEVTFDAANLTSGVYIYRLQTGDFSAVEKMLLLK